MPDVRVVNPPALGAPSGYANGVVAGPGRHLFVAGQIAWDGSQRLVGRDDFAAQFAQALDNVLAVVAEAGGRPEHVVRLTIYVTDKRRYLAATKAIGEAYRARMGRHFPAMTLVQVADLLEDGALLEIEGTAVLSA